MVATDAPRSYEMICENSRMAGIGGDHAAWIIGDDALEVETRYGEHTLDDFAREIGKAKGSVREYRGMAGFWTFSARAEISETCPNITRSHMRKAKSLKDPDKARWAVEKCSERGWTVDRFGYILKRYRQMKGMIEATPKQPEPIGEFMAAGAELMYCAMSPMLDDDKQYRCVVYEVPDAESALTINTHAPRVK